MTQTVTVLGATGSIGRSTADLNGSLHPIYFLARFSVGVAFD